MLPEGSRATRRAFYRVPARSHPVRRQGGNRAGRTRTSRGRQTSAEIWQASLLNFDKINDLGKSKPSPMEPMNKTSLPAPTSAFAGPQGGRPLSPQLRRDRGHLLSASSIWPKAVAVNGGPKDGARPPEVRARWRSRWHGPRGEAPRVTFPYTPAVEEGARPRRQGSEGPEPFLRRHPKHHPARLLREGEGWRLRRASKSLGLDISAAQRDPTGRARSQLFPASRRRVSVAAVPPAPRKTNGTRKDPRAQGLRSATWTELAKKGGAGPGDRAPGTRSVGSFKSLCRRTKNNPGP